MQNRASWKQNQSCKAWALHLSDMRICCMSWPRCELPGIRYACLISQSRQRENPGNPRVARCPYSRQAFSGRCRSVTRCSAYHPEIRDREYKCIVGFESILQQSRNCLSPCHIFMYLLTPWLVLSRHHGRGAS